MTATAWPQPEGPPGRTSRMPGWAKLVVVLIVLAALGWVVLLGTQYLKTGKPISELPGAQIPGLAGQGEQYRSSVFGVAQPLGVAVGRDGRMYVTESAGQRMVRIFDPQGHPLSSFAPPNTTANGRVPVYIAVSPQGDVYVTDRANDALDVFSADGAFLRAFDPAEVRLLRLVGAWHPMGVAFDKDGNLYVTDVSADKHRVLVFDPSGTLKLTFGSQGTDEGKFWYPNGLAVDDRGRIWVADGNNGRVQAFDAHGKFLTAIARGFAKGDLAMPRGVAIDGNNHLFVADTSAHTVKVYDISGDRPEFLRDLGEAGTGDGQFRFPNGVAFSGGRLYVTDRENGRVQVWSD